MSSMPGLVVGTSGKGETYSDVRKQKQHREKTDKQNRPTNTTKQNANKTSEDVQSQVL